MRSKILVATISLFFLLACNQTNKAESSSHEETNIASAESNADITPEQETSERVTIQDVVENPERYKNKFVTVSGKCTKINMEIMGRNWIHLIDGSKDDFDFVITSNAKVKKGDEITMTGVITIDKDFGHGYRYEVIMEEAELVK